MKVTSSPATGLSNSSATVAVSTCCAAPSAVFTPLVTEKVEWAASAAAAVQDRVSLTPICSAPRPAEMT